MWFQTGEFVPHLFFPVFVAELMFSTQQLLLQLIVTGCGSKCFLRSNVGFVPQIWGTRGFNIAEYNFSVISLHFRSFLYPQGVWGTVSWSCPEFCGRRGHACLYFLSFIMFDYSSAHPCSLSSIPDTLLMLGLCWRWVALYLLFDLLSISLLTFLFCLCQSFHFVPDFLVYGHSCLFSPGLGIIFLLHSPSCLHPLWGHCSFI